MVEKKWLSEGDKALLQSATHRVRSAQELYSFVSQHLASLYGIDESAKIIVETGEIVRPEKPE